MTEIFVVDSGDRKPSLSSSSLIPTGVMFEYGGDSAPAGFLLCDGSEVSRDTYADLFAVIGTKFGTGDGMNTFNLPNFQRRVALGKADSGGQSSVGDNGGSFDHSHAVDSHSHTVNSHAHTVDSHAHGLGSHTHSIGSHTHDLNSHKHEVPIGLMGSVVGRADADGSCRWWMNKPVDYGQTGDKTFTSVASAWAEDVASDVLAIDSNPGGGGVTNFARYPYTSPASGSTGGGSGSTGAAAGSTDADSPGTDSQSPGTDSQSPGTDSDNQAYLVVTKIIKT